MKSILRTIEAILVEGMRMLLFPIAPVVNDRIRTLNEYERWLSWKSRARKERKRWSLLSRLRRAARRQTKKNVEGEAWLHELVAHQYERLFCYVFWGKFLLFAFAIAYAGDAFEGILREQYPAAFVIWMELMDKFGRAHDGAWQWIWEHTGGGAP